MNVTNKTYSTEVFENLQTTYLDHDIITINFQTWDMFKPNNIHKVIHLDQIKYTLSELGKINHLEILKTNRNNIILSGVLDINSKVIYGFTKTMKPYKLFTPFNKNFPNFLVSYDKNKKKKKKIMSQIKL